MQLDDGEVDRKPRVHLSTLRVHSHTPFVDLLSVLRVFSDPYRSRRAEHDGGSHTAAVSSQCSSGVLKGDCVRGFGMQMCHVSPDPVTWCGLPLGMG